MARAWAAIFVILGIGLFAGESSCDNKVEQSGEPGGGIEACSGFEEFAYENSGVGLVAFLVAGIGYVGIRRYENTRPCPRCGERVEVGVMDCPRCGFDFDTL